MWEFALRACVNRTFDEVKKIDCDLGLMRIKLRVGNVDVTPGGIVYTNTTVSSNSTTVFNSTKINANNSTVNISELIQNVNDLNSTEIAELCNDSDLSENYVFICKLAQDPESEDKL